MSVYMTNLSSLMQSRTCNKMNQSSRYPKKNEFGDASPRCRWCGQRFSPPRFTLNEDLERHLWCSSECRAAGGLYGNIGIALVIMAVLVSIILIGALSEGSHTTKNIDGMIITIGILGIFMLMTLKRISLGLKVRSHDGAHPKQSDVLPRNLSKLHKEILEYIMTFPANDGVSYIQIKTHFQNKGYLVSHVASALLDLEGLNKIKQPHKGRYSPS